MSVDKPTPRFGHVPPAAWALLPPPRSAGRVARASATVGELVFRNPTPAASRRTLPGAGRESPLAPKGGEGGTHCGAMEGEGKGLGEKGMAKFYAPIFSEFPNCQLVYQILFNPDTAGQQVSLIKEVNAELEAFSKRT